MFIAHVTFVSIPPGSGAGSGGRADD